MFLFGSQMPNSLVVEMYHLILLLDPWDCIRSPFPWKLSKAKTLAKKDNKETALWEGCTPTLTWRLFWSCLEGSETRMCFGIKASSGDKCNGKGWKRDVCLKSTLLKKSIGRYIHIGPELHQYRARLYEEQALWFHHLQIVTIRHEMSMKDS